MIATILCFDRLEHYNRWVKSNPAERRWKIVSLSGILDGCTDDDRQFFLKNYVDLVGQMSVCNHSLLWWATDISSKNRFFTPLEPYLEKFFKLMRHVEQSTDETLIFIDVPLEIYGSVRQVLGSKGVHTFWYGARLEIIAAAFKEFFVRGGRILKHLIFILPRILEARRSLGPIIAKVAQDSDPVYVFKTFVSSRSFDAKGGYKDLFFGILPDFISANRRIIILADVMDDFAKTVDLMNQWGKDRTFALESFLKIRDVLLASIWMFFYRVQVPDQLKFGPYDVSNLVQKVCCAHGSKIQPVQLYQYFVMKNFQTQFNVSDFVFTCEFNPWEKMCLWALSEQSSGAKTIGYQHTVVPHASANMFVSRFEQDIVPRAHKILTVGQKPKEIILRYETCDPSKISAACGLRFEYFDYPQGQRTNRGHILLALEGLPQVAEMTDYVLKQIASNNQYKLKIRTHPVLPLDKFVHQLSMDPRNIPGVLISKAASLKEDLEWADIVIYWGTTVALEAVSIGKPVIHYDMGSIVRYDPLFEVTDFKWVVNNLMPLAQVIDGIYNLPDEIYYTKREAVQGYIQQYFHRVTPDSLGLFQSL